MIENPNQSFLQETIKDSGNQSWNMTEKPILQLASQQ